MSRTVGAGSYRALLAAPVVRRTFALAMVGRFGYALLPLCLLFTIARATGSFAVAATASGLFGVGGLIMPVQARLLDRHGQRRVLPIAGAGFSLALAAVAALAAGGHRGAAGWYAVTAVAGVTAPALGASMRAQWRSFTEGGQRSTAYALDAVAEEAAFLLGPVAASVWLAAGQAWHGVAVAAALIPIGVLGLTTSPAAARRPSPAPAPVSGPAPAPASAPVSGPVARPGSLRRRPFLALLAVMLLAGLTMSAAVTCVAAMAEHAGRPAVTGFVEAAAGVAAVAGGLWWGRRPAGGGWSRQLTLLLLARLPLLAACVPAPNLWAVGVFVALSGFVLSPLYVVAFTASDELVPDGRQTEASTWVTATTNIGISVGTALAGWLHVHSGASAVFAGTAVVLLAAAVVARRAGRPGTPPTPEHPPTPADPAPPRSTEPSTPIDPTPCRPAEPSSRPAGQPPTPAGQPPQPAAPTPAGQPLRPDEASLFQR